MINKNYLLKLIPNKVKEYITYQWLKKEGLTIDKSYKKISLDKDFIKIAEKVIKEGRTYLGIDRLYTLWQCVKQLPIDMNIMEIGVYKGGSLKFLALARDYFEKDCEIWGIDTFEGHVQINESLDGNHKERDNFSDVNVMEVSRYLDNFDNVILIENDIKLVSQKLGFQNNLGLVHIDVDVYEATKFSLFYGLTRLDLQGFIIVDDYGFKTCKGAKQAVDEFVAEKLITMFHLFTGQALIFKK